MNIKLIETNTKPKFPSLMISTDGTIILLMLDDSFGTVIYSTDKDYRVGYYDDNWDINDFKYYTGKIELSNE